MRRQDINVGLRKINLISKCQIIKIDFDIIVSQTLQTSSKFHQHVVFLETEIKLKVFKQKYIGVFIPYFDLSRAITFIVKLSRRKVS